jgi:UDP-N-acetylglucosamine--N-acetylmuramyl-(pentapeptide) pyrophosphoryl-undecaprenol N-acetylglucosamine transferase
VTRRTVVLAGGGTGGHVLPIVAIAEALCARGIDPSQLQFMASARGPDQSILDGRGFPAVYVTGRGIKRSMRLSALRDNVGAVIGLLRAVGHAVVDLRGWRPSVVVSAGGYAAFPAVVGAVVLHIPLVIVNIDAVPGLVHQIFGRFATASCVGFENTPLRHAVVTGAPLSEAVRHLERSPEQRRAARQRLGLGDGRVVAFVGGSLGATRLNVAARQLLTAAPDVEIYHVCGTRSYDELAATPVPGDARTRYHLVPFEHAMADLYLAADVVVARSGAMTVAELAASKTPSILVPLPGAPGDHQRHNAEALERVGGALVVNDGDCTGAHLAAMLSSVGPSELDAMSAAAGTCARADAADTIADVVLGNVD